MTYVLILIMHVGALGTGNSNAMTTADFSSKQKCEEAGKQAKKLTSGTVKVIEYTCVEK